MSRPKDAAGRTLGRNVRPGDVVIDARAWRRDRQDAARLLVEDEMSAGGWKAKVMTADEPFPRQVTVFADDYYIVIEEATDDI